MPEVRRGVRIGVDVGAVRVGVARSDPSGMLATPVETIRRTATDDGVARLAQIVREHEAMEVVVGLPKHLSGSAGKAAEDALAYAGRLAHAVGAVPVRLVDERLTTVTAHQTLHRAGRSSRNHRQVVDQVAAVLILQMALDTERSTGEGAGQLIDRKDVTDTGGEEEIP